MLTEPVQDDILILSILTSAKTFFGGMLMISTKSLGLTYRSGKGIFDITFTVPQGKATGYLGPNGAGKTTTIRFMQANSGSCTIQGLDCYRAAAKIKKSWAISREKSLFPAV